MFYICIVLLTIPLLVYSQLFGNCSQYTSCFNCLQARFSRSQCEWCTTDNTCRTYGLNLCAIESRIPHPYNCPKRILHEVYDEDFTREVYLPLIGFAQTTSKPDLNRRLQTCFYSVQLVNNYLINCDRTNLTTCYSYQAYLPDYNAIVLSFRGTMNIYQLIDQGISFFLAKKVAHKPTNGTIDAYYFKAFNGLWNFGMKTDFETLLQNHPDAEIWTVGHSLGGGLASIAATHISYYYNASDRLKLTTFGQPRVGNIDFAIGHDRLVPNSIRIINRYDPVASVPRRSFSRTTWSGAFHHRYEIWYPFSMLNGPYVIDRKADAVSFSTSLRNMGDHLNYFGVNLDRFHKVGCRYRLPS